MKKALVIFLVFILAVGVFLFMQRYKIFQYSAEKIILSALPEYLKIEKIDFNLQNNEITAKNLHIANPAGFSGDPFLMIGSIVCRYKLRSANPLNGIDITAINADDVTLRIERLENGRTNIEEMKNLSQAVPKTPEAKVVSDKPEEGQSVPGSKKPADLVRLPDAIKIANGRIIFTDNAIYQGPYVLTFDNIRAAVSLKLNEYFSKVLYLSSTGSGYINGRPNEILNWTISLTPTTPKLTMSNRYKVSGADIMPFQPYFTQYSPFVFRSGRFSGDLVFDFDNGDIGSTNTISLENLSFAIKQGYENASFWQTTVPDLMKYLTTSRGAVLFDFKIKGPMSKPKFYLGPITKRAMASMAVDKISDAISKATKDDGGTTKMEKAQDVINLFQGLMKKN